MEQLSFENIIPKSSLAVRLLANYARLEGEWYRPDEVFTADKSGWPGDWEGRLILALALHAQCSRRYPAYLDEILGHVPEHLNPKGYFGPVLEPGVSDEQQMAGHSWYLRALLECRKLGLSRVVNPLIDMVVRNLLLPTAGNYARYPLDPATRWESPYWKLSRLQSKASTHAETSDCGCAFIMLDGATAYYREHRDRRVRSLIYEMIARFRQVDFEAIHMQTHATLSACRGILRMYKIERDPTLLAVVRRVFGLYRRVAWTDVYGNYNWFGLPRWTEPCAIIDSFMLAMQLWELTAEPEWLADAHFVYYNALAHAQRATGAFGTDTCVGPAGAVLAPITYEVTWCCTMRAGEGLTAAVRSLFFVDGADVYLPFYGDCTATVPLGRGRIVLIERTAYPAEGTVELKVESSTAGTPVTFHFFMPPGTRRTPSVRHNGAVVRSTMRQGMLCASLRLKRGDNITVTFTPTLWTRASSMSTRRAPGRLFMHGPCVLGCDESKGQRISAQAKLVYLRNGEYRVGRSTVVLRPLCDVRRLTRQDSRTKVVFQTRPRRCDDSEK